MHAFTPKSEILFRVVIRGIHPFTNVTDIDEKEISTAGHLIHGQIVAAMYRSQKDKLLPIHFVSLKKAVNNVEMYNL